jgi:phosphomevalonate kinase
MGAIFCQESKIMFLYQFSPSITLGNQKWKGAAPIFKSNVDAINSIKYFSIRDSFKSNHIKITEKSKIADAKAWVIKYFKDASEENKFFDLVIKGIKDKRLISNPIQILNQEEEEMATIVPIIIEKINTSL